METRLKSLADQEVLSIDSPSTDVVHVELEINKADDEEGSIEDEKEDGDVVIDVHDDGQVTIDDIPVDEVAPIPYQDYPRRQRRPPAYYGYNEDESVNVAVDVDPRTFKH